MSPRARKTCYSTGSWNGAYSQQQLLAPTSSRRKVTQTRRSLLTISDAQHVILATLAGLFASAEEWHLCELFSQYIIDRPSQCRYVQEMRENRK